MMRTRLLPLLSLFALALGPAAGAAEGSGFYRLDSNWKLAGKSPGWDYVSLDAKRHHLFIGRRDDGVSVVDSKTGKLIATIKDSGDANVALLVEELDRGFTANGDGSTTIFRLSDLKTIQRVKYGEDADSAFYDSATGQVLFTMGDSKSLAFLDAKTLQSSGRIETESKKLDGTIADGSGRMIVAERDRDALLVVDMRAHKVTAEWKTTGCSQPTGLAIDRVNHRLFVGCRSATPVLLVMNSDDGAVVASQEIGRGNDGVIFDEAEKRIYSSNGVDGNVVIIDQLDPDHYKLSQAFSTRPSARTMALDPDSKRLFLVTADGIVDPAKPINRAVSAFYPNRYWDDSFVILSYGRH